MAKKTFYKNKRFISRLYGAICVILFVSLSYHVYTNTTKMLEMNAKSDSYSKLHPALSKTKNLSEQEYIEVKEENKELMQRIKNELELVFPNSENHTILTRNLDKLANNLHRSLEPFMISNLQYMASKEAEDNGHMVLPFKMTIHSSYKNFFAFLRYVQNSGSLSEKTRLLDMPSIVINFVSPSGAQDNISGQNEINFNVSANAYFRSTEL